MGALSRSLLEAFQDASRKTTELISPLLQAALFVMVTYFAIVAICEVAARDMALAHIDSMVESKRAAYIERQGKVESPDQVKLLAEITWLQDKKVVLQSLVMVGTNHQDTLLASIHRGLVEDPRRGQREPEMGYVKNLVGDAARAMGEINLGFATLSSDLLLAIAVMACGAIGAMITTLRGGAKMTIRSFCLGLAAGFIVFLAIKGGKHLFLLQARGEIAAFNPYGSAFAGLLAGLFTEKAYAALAEIVDEFINRLKTAARGGGASTEAPLTGK
jgi:hypothetical protein